MDRRTVLFVVLSAAFLIVWWVLFPPQPPPKAPAGMPPSGETADKTKALAAINAVFPMNFAVCPWTCKPTDKWTWDEQGGKL